MSLPKINLVVVGHKDHGKSTLIGRLLYDSKAIPEEKLREIREELKKAGRKGFEFAFILDSLEEEREGGLTIDIMQTPFKSKRYFYTIIDCPGHREFIKKMLTGASQADAAILVVSAMEGVEDQTRQHLFLIKTLGISQLVVAVNKMDMVGYDEERFNEISGRLREVLSSMRYEDTPIIPVSAFSGDNVTEPSANLGWYKGTTLIEALDRTVKPLGLPLDKPMRCIVQDVYEVGDRRIAACRVETGVLRVGRAVRIMPSNETGMVEEIESLGGKVEEALPGDAVGLAISGVDKIERGHILSYPEEPVKASARFTAELMIFSDMTLRNGDILTIRVGTTDARCQVERILERIDPIHLTIDERNPEHLADGDVGKVVFHALEPLCLEGYLNIPQLGRFVVVGRSGTAAAGIVLAIKSKL